MTFQDIVNYRRSVRLYKNVPVDSEIVKRCLELAVLSPNSSNMQLWEFYHVTDKGKLKLLSHYCLDQSAATSAQEMVVFVTRQDLFNKRRRKMVELESLNVKKNSPAEKQSAQYKAVGAYITVKSFHFSMLGFSVF
jgi:nitroreductase